MSLLNEIILQFPLNVLKCHLPKLKWDYLDVNDETAKDKCLITI